MHSLGSLIIDLAGTRLTPEEAELIAHPMVGGVILFARNYETKAGLTHLCASIRAATPNPRLIMVDQEGGRVQRFITEFTRLAPIATLGETYDQNPEAGLAATKQHAKTMASELLAVGIDVSLAPVLDLNKGVSSIIGNRAFHRDPKTAALLAKTYSHSMQAAGMPAVGKHYPGHGSVAPDSHLESPIDDRSLDDLLSDDLYPFTELIQANIPGIMASHLIFPAVCDKPVAFSHTWLTQLLRGRFGYQGVILSDDLSMKGACVVGDSTTRVIESKEAGCDFALLCNNREGVIHALDHLPAKSHQVPPERWQALQGKHIT